MKHFVKIKISLLFLVILLWSSSLLAQNKEWFPYPERIKYDYYGLQIEGKDTFIYSGAFHYFRCPKELWRDRFAKIKQAGLNAVETYVPWNRHETDMPAYPGDYSKMDLSDLEEWMTIAEEFGFYTIIRPGPYICAEWDGGGFPHWLVTYKKPSEAGDQAWLQTNDPEFLAWNKHWYDAVCHVVAPHQITRREPGEPGVIMFQIENEYERIKFISKEEKKKYLEDLTLCAKQAGIEVPIFTCWTRESRGVEEGPLAGVFDFMNFYPRWNIERGMARSISQRKEQPFAPAMSAELQGGWYSEVGGPASKDMDGISPVQTQNITLYAIQLGFSLINYYMFVGGTNFDDWASRETTTTYDFNAAIHENGGSDERYRRVCGMAAMLKEHGSRIMRSDIIETETKVTHPEVKVAVKHSIDGSRYIFVRTEEKDRALSGNIYLKEPDGTAFSFDYALEPFGSQIYYLPPGATAKTKGEWYPKLPDPVIRPVNLPGAAIITSIEYRTDDLPAKWTQLSVNEKVEDYGIYGRHFIYYQIPVDGGSHLSVARLGKGVVNGSQADGIQVKVNGELLIPITSDEENIIYQIPGKAKIATLIYQNRGLHHHTNPTVEKHWFNGIHGIKVNGKEQLFKFASTEKEKGIQYSQINNTTKDWTQQQITGNEPIQNQLLTWHRINFRLPEIPPGIWVSWKMKIEAKGSGFIYLNGRCLGRYWEEGPQHEYYLPECWLNFEKGVNNRIVISLSPTEENKYVEIISISVEPDKEYAEYK